MKTFISCCRIARSDAYYMDWAHSPWYRQLLRGKVKELLSDALY